MKVWRRRVRKQRNPQPQRDQEPSSFTDILQHLVDVIPGAHGAALVDEDGETVDYAGMLDTFQLKVSAAHWQIILADFAATRLGVPRQVTIRARKSSYVIRTLQSGYALVLVLHPRAAFAVSDRALQEADVRLCLEAGWNVSGVCSGWYRVDVETEVADRDRPARLRAGNAWQSVEVMGCMVGLRPREKGFRVRLPSGAEMLLVRERMGRWFADEHLDS